MGGFLNNAPLKGELTFFREKCAEQFETGMETCVKEHLLWIEIDCEFNPDAASHVGGI